MSLQRPRQSQKEIFLLAQSQLKSYDKEVVSLLIQDLFILITECDVVLDGFLMRQYDNGNDVAIMRCRIKGVFCNRPYHLPVSILYPMDKNDMNKIRFFLIVLDNTLKNQCSYVNENNEIIIKGADQWTYKNGLYSCIKCLQYYLSCQCPLYELIPPDAIIQYSELDIEDKVLGEGAYASVHPGIYQSQKVALKIMKNNPVGKERSRLEIEFRTQMSFKHETILQILGYCENPEGRPILVMELADTSLETIIMKKKEKLTNQQKKKYLLDVAKALEYLHSYNYIHRDIKLDNILIKNGVAKVGDFGFAREIENNTSMEVSTCGTPMIMAPELLENAKCSTKVDVYSFGCVMYEVIGEKRCYDTHLSGKELGLRVIQGMRPTIRIGMPKEPCELMKRCWMTDKMRPTMKEIVTIIEKWDISTWDTNVITSADLDIELWNVCSFLFDHIGSMFQRT